MAQADCPDNSSSPDQILKQASSSASQTAVERMFDRIAPTYALLNHVLSFGQDFTWRRKLARSLSEDHPIEVLDLATGTGDLLISMFRCRTAISKGVGLDISENMLAVCRKNIERAGLTDRVVLMQADAARTHLPDSGFDVVTMAFGIRNVSDPAGTLREMHRLLRQGGRVLILEFSLPAKGLLRSLYLIYLRHFVPLAGYLVSRDKGAYRYLNTTIEGFSRSCDLPELMRKAGFVDVDAKPMTFGTVSLYSGCKPRIAE